MTFVCTRKLFPINNPDINLMYFRWRYSENKHLLLTIVCLVHSRFEGKGERKRLDYVIPGQRTFLVTQLNLIQVLDPI